jgi:two-component system LytT family sensor kinase
MDKNEQRICWYTSVLIVLTINTPKLLALRENSIAARYWHFNLAELLFQVFFNLLFCWLLFSLNLKPYTLLSTYRSGKKHIAYVGLNILIFVACTLIGGILQRILFYNHKPVMLWAGYVGRLGLSSILMGILIRIVLLLRDTKRRDVEHEQLKTAYMATELELLKEQINPHFLFNSLSSLSGVIRENPELAQKYVRELSNVFRYALLRAKVNMVTLEEELIMLRSFAQLITMRLEYAFELVIDVDSPMLLAKLPHLSLQPLLENAVKHNAATIKRPLHVLITVQSAYLVVSNTLNEIPTPESSNGLGLSNLNERYKIMMGKEIEISKTGNEFIVKLPLSI